MKQLKTLLIVLLLGVLCVGAITTTTSDKRITGLMNPVARLQFGQLSWATSAGHGEQTSTIYVNGTIYRMDVITSTVAGNADLTVDIGFTDGNGSAFGNELNQTGLAHSMAHYYDSQSSTNDDADFNPITHAGNITLAGDTNEDTGGTAQTLTVDVILFVR